MQVTEALLVKFIENKCSRTEMEAVYAYLLQHPHAIDELLPDAEWDTYQSNGVVDQQQSDAWLTAIQKQKSSTRIIVLKRWLRVSAAAVVLMATGLFVYQQMKPAPVKGFKPVTILLPPPQGQAAKHTKFINSGDKPLTYTLSDGSMITLYKNSIIECDQPFDSVKRDLLLHGEALFTVAKDKTRPFTVYTENFSTMALGTVFTISAYNNQREPGVKLISGKVVVKNLKAAADPVYMHPGDECFFKASAKTLKLHTHKVIAPKDKMVTHVEQAITETEEVIIFANAPLQQVFNNISSNYQVKIHIEAKHLQNRKFTGTQFRNESPDELLSTIAGLNNLEISKEGNVYLLRYKE